MVKGLRVHTEGGVGGAEAWAEPGWPAVGSPQRSALSGL